MLYCTKCGYVIGQNDNYCVNCGNPQGETVFTVGRFTARFPVKPSTNFSNGFMVGMGIILLLTSLSALSWLNGSYWDIQGRLLAEGISLTLANLILSDTVLLMSFCLLIGLFGIYMLIYGLILQFSPTMNSLVHNRGNYVNWGFGLISGSVIIFNGGFSDIMLNFYGQKNGLTPVSYGLTILGLFLVVIGIIIILNAYRKSRKAITKV